MEYIERLIAKYLSGTLSEEEAGVLRRWVGQSPEREARLRSLQERNDFVLKYRRYAAVDSENAKHRFVRSVRRRIGWVTPRRVIYYAAVVLPFVALSIWFAQKEEPEVPGFTLSEVTPGATQAILLMDNGTELALTGQGERTIALDDSLSAQMEDGAITYSPSVASKSKVECHTIVVPRGGEYRITLSNRRSNAIPSSCPAAANTALPFPTVRECISMPTRSCPRVKVPVLALNGDCDIMVPAGPNLQSLDSLLHLGGNRHYRTVALPGLNHMFQHCVTCRQEEIPDLPDVFAEEALEEIFRFLQRYVL